MPAKLDIGDFYENLLRKLQIWLKSGKNVRLAVWLPAKLNHNKNSLFE
jgi:hypothetical protein